MEVLKNNNRHQRHIHRKMQRQKLKAAHKSQDLAQIDTATTEMNAAWATASEDMYKDTQAGAQPGGEEAQGGDQKAKNDADAENVTDAEFEEVK